MKNWPKPFWANDDFVAITTEANDAGNLSGHTENETPPLPPEWMWP